eukprot:2877151-Prymnesium_polylepis.1
MAAAVDLRRKRSGVQASDTVLGRGRAARGSRRAAQRGAGARGAVTSRTSSAKTQGAATPSNAARLRSFANTAHANTRGSAQL